jgi:hypothetical protein
MKVKLFSLVLLLSGLSGRIFAQRNCGTMDQHQNLMNSFPEMIQNREAIEQQTERFVKDHSNDKNTGIIYTIPVVVHIVYRTTAENISDAQVQSQIDVLNEDFRLLNADAANAPSLFSALRKDVEINFCLAKRDPAGAATTGITRTVTTRTSFGTNDAVKSSSTGGKSPWNTAAYMNLWVCNIGGGILGYAQFPGGPATTDGVVIDYRYFGRGGSAVAPFNKGRTGTHEVGHYLNLFHIWGDDGTGCTGSDQVADTPNQADPNYGCPSFPNPSCSNTSDMHMNYMDYSDDACMYMFSAGQATRMRALFAAGGARAGLSSTTPCTPPSTATCGVPASLASSNITATSATVSWGAVTNAVSYNVRYKTSTAATFTTVNTTSTSLNLTGLTAGTTYNYQVQTVCASGSSAYSSQASFTTTSATVTYCASKGNSVADEWIDRVSLNKLTRTSTGNAGYIYFTTTSANVTAGTSYSLGYSAGFRSGYSANEFWKIWIDWNRDGVFSDATELVVNRSSTSSANLTTTITVPASARNGTTRMRVSMKWNSAQTSCETFSYGEVEDYNVLISGGTTRETNLDIAGDETTNDLQMFPNPAHDRITVQKSEAGWQENAAIMMVDMKGKVWTPGILNNSSSGQDNVELKVNDLPNGLYNLIIVSGKERISRKVIILHP